MPVLNYEKLTHQELSGLERDKTVIFLPVSPLEEHGTHLPLGNDAYLASYFTDVLVKGLLEKRSDWNYLIMPTVFAGTDTLIYPGSIETPPRMLRALLFNQCKQLAKNGFRKMITVSGHGGPRHIVVLEELSARMAWQCRTRMVSAISGFVNTVLDPKFREVFFKTLEEREIKLTAEEKAALDHDYHGGFLETSIMLVAQPKLVKDHFKTLKPAILSSLWKFRRTSGRTIGEGLGHLGYPHLARKDVGEALTEAVTKETLPYFLRFLDGENVGRKFRTKFYYLPFLRTDFRLLLVMAVYLAFFAIAWRMLHIYVLEGFR